MNQTDIYKNALNLLEAKGINVNVNILEMSCILYCKKKSKTENFLYLKQLNFNSQKIAAIINIVECMTDLNHEGIPSYMDYIDALRSVLTLKN